MQVLDQIPLTMPPILATIICILFIVYLFWTDLRQPGGPSGALWVPLGWMFLAGSRFPSFWLNLRPTFASAADIAEGSPVDRAFFLALIVVGILILATRKIDWQKLWLNNSWIALYFLYCLASMAWADEPTLVMTRWVKDLGNPVMALVILTERRPYEAVGAVLRRLAFLTLPLSVLFIKYYPELGRGYHFHTGTPMYTGVGDQKNSLGLLCLLAGIYLFWALLQRHETTNPVFTRQHKLIAIVLFGMLAWLQHMSDSQTSFVCLVVAVLLLLLGRMPPVARRPGRIFGVLFCGLFTVWLLDELPQVQELAFGLLGRDPTLTDRTDIWRIVSGFEVNPFVGVGFMSFWSGERLEELWRLLGELNQAHNGYLEQYLNLGYIGVAFIAVIMLSGLLRVRRQLSVDPAAGMLRLCIIVSAILYNYTEASFYGMNDMWVLLLLGCIEVPRQSRPRAVDNRPWRRPMMQGKTGIINRPIN